MKRILKLTIKKKWFDMIKSGEKPDEYREIKLFWVGRLMQANFPKNSMESDSFSMDEYCEELQRCTMSDKEMESHYNCSYRHYTHIQFFNGAYFSEKLPNFLIELNGIKRDTGSECWGAIPDVIYFVLMLGKIAEVS